MTWTVSAFDSGPEAGQVADSLLPGRGPVAVPGRNLAATRPSVNGTPSATDERDGRAYGRGRTAASSKGPSEMDDPGRIDAYRDEIVPDAPLYDAGLEHDACGVGFVAESRRGPSERVVPLALAALAAMAHRGATAADARTSDGSGLALPLAPALLERITARLPGAPADLGRLAVGTVFLPRCRGRARRGDRAWSSALWRPRA